MLRCVTRGGLIVLEGVDGAGTTTQVARIAARLRAGGARVHTTAEPSAGPIGRLLRRALSGELGEGDAPEPATPSWQTLALLFAADRLDHLAREVEPELAAGAYVICDRYDHSTLAYQSVAGGGDAAIPWLRELNRHARRPDLTLVLDVPPSVAAERRRARQGPAEIFDADALQVRLAAFYARLERHYPGERIVHLDGTRALDAVTDTALAAIERVITGA
jgi:dTMP kinase